MKIERIIFVDNFLITEKERYESVMIYYTKSNHN